MTHHECPPGGCQWEVGQMTHHQCPPKIVSGEMGSGHTTSVHRNVVSGEFVSGHATSAHQTVSGEMGRGHTITVNRHVVSMVQGRQQNLSFTGFIPSCLRRGTDGDRDPGRWGKRGAVPTASLSPPELLYTYRYTVTTRMTPYLTLHYHHQNDSIPITTLSPPE